MFESGWFGRSPAFWRWEAKPYVEAFVNMHRKPVSDEPLDLLKILARDIEARFTENGN